MALISRQQAKISGQQVTHAAASAGGETFRPSERTVLSVRNGGAGPVTVTVVVPGQTKYAQADPDVAVTVPAGQDYLVGPFPQDLADPSDGLVHVTYSGVTSVNVALVGV